MLLSVGADLGALYSDLKKRVRTRRVLVHSGRADGPVFNADRHDILNLSGCLGRIVRKVLHVNTGVGLLMKLYSVLRVFRKQVSNLLVVNFKVRSANQELSLVGVALDVFKNVLERTRHDTFVLRIALHARHGMGLACAGLAVGKDGPVVAS